ncbi:helix-turn-helix domain-containing protein [Enterococcus faecalis]|uniref:helix-turn-helix domain-containing protein n=1 Tax=Enterococcus faecalis TaxID=1351 RepID=UPI003D0A1947
MDKCTIIRLLESGRSKRSVAKELNIHRSTVTKYWKEYLQKKNKLPLILWIQVKKKHLLRN